MAVLPRHHHHQAGFTSAEALVAAFLIAVGLVALAGLFPVAHQSISTASQRTTATLLAEQGLELARNNLLNNWNWAPPATDNLLGEFAGYTRTTQVEPVGTNLKRVTVNASFPNRVSVQLVTVLGN